MKTFRVVIDCGSLAAPIYLFLVGAAGAQGLPRSEPAPQVAAPSSRRELYTVPSAQPLQRLEDAFLRWPLLPGAERYSSIDGKRLHELVVQQAAISRKFRDSGHAQYWGRIIGSSADEESAQWLFNQFRRIGLSDVRIQSLPIPNPVWEPVEPWSVYARTAERTLPLGSAQPSYESPAAPSEGLDLEAVYIGTGSEADFIGRDVRGKVAVLLSVPMPGATWQTAQADGALRRAEERGAAALLVILALPGNFRAQLYPTGGKIPTFYLGMEEGYALRDMIGSAHPGQPPRVEIQFQTKRIAGRKTATVWGSLPGTTDEKIYIMAHRDGWFDAAGDNASGVATMIGLAEYFAKVPQASRRRTLVFMGISGHHGPAMSGQDLLARKDELFRKTALLINAEHTSTLQTYLHWEAIRPANTYTAQFWYAGGLSRPKLQQIAINAFRQFGVSTYAAPEQGAPLGDLRMLWPFVPAVTTTDFNMYFHTDAETPDKVPWTGLEATTRSLAKIIDDVNQLDLKDLERPPEAAAERH